MIRLALHHLQHDEHLRPIGMLQTGRTQQQVANVFDVSQSVIADFGAGFCRREMLKIRCPRSTSVLSFSCPSITVIVTLSYI